VDLLKSQEINLDYILEQIFENNKQVRDKTSLVEDVRRMIRASLGK
jgi:type I restriction enzyme R subunit